MIKIPQTVIALDFETYYDKDYTLKKISTTEYIRHEKFKAQGVSIRTNSETRTCWYRDRDVKHALDNIDWNDCAMLAHHAHFDGLILQHHYGHVPAFYLCTLSMARPLHGGAITNDLDTLSKFYGGRGKKTDILERTKGIRDLPPPLMQELGEYCNRDVNEMCRIYDLMLKHYSDKELALIHYTVKAYADPVLQLDTKIADRVHKEEINNRIALLERVALPKETLRSRPKFAAELKKRGVEPPMKTSPTTGKPTFAFAKNDIVFQEIQAHPNEQVRDLIEARLACQSSIEETRAARLILHSQPALPIYLAYGKAHTLRWAGGDKMNPQNIGRNSDLRNAITAPPGHKLVIVDSGQIEARVNGWLAGEEELTEAFRNGDDIYSEFAGDEIYFIAIDKVTKIHRFVGKVCILGLGFQMGWKKFKYTLEAGVMGPKVVLDNDEMYSSTVAHYRDRFPKIVEQWKVFSSMLPRMSETKDLDEEYGPIRFRHESILLPNGMSLRYPNLESPEGWNEYYKEWGSFNYNNGRKIYGGLLVENVVQALARIIVAEQILRVAHLYRIVLLVHDEVVLCVPDNKAEEALECTLKSFHTPLEWCKDLPVVGEGTISQCYIKM